MPIVISDLDGTLLDVRDRFINAQVNALSGLGFRITADQVSPLVRYTMDAGQFLEGLGLTLSQEQLIHYFVSIEEEFYRGWQHSQVFPGVIDALTEIRPNLDALRLITSRAWVEETRREVKLFGLDHIFDYPIFTRGDLARAEGKDEIPLIPYLAHRQRLIQFAIADIKPKSQVFVLGDSPNEMRAAQNLGYTAVGVLSGFFSQTELESVCDFVINSVADISQII